MSYEITTARVQQYKDNVRLLSQQKGSRLRPLVRIESQKGKTAYYDQIGATAAQKLTQRHGDTPLISTPHSRRAVTLVDYIWADLIDDADRLKLLMDPTSQYGQNASYAMGRAMDDQIIAAAFADAKTGEDGTSTTSFPASNTIAAGAAGLTLAKLLTAKEILDASDVDPDIPRHIAVTTNQVSDLLNTTEIKSSDYNTVKALAMGSINSFLGFNFVRTERVDTSSAPARRVICWAEDGLLLAIAKDISVRVSERDDKNYSTQVFVSMGLGATRMEEAKVVEILCTE